MKKSLALLAAIIIMASQIQAQVEPGAGNWKPWFIKSGKAWRLPPPPSSKVEIAQVISRQQKLDSATWQQIIFWNSGSPGYRWQTMIGKLWMTDTTYNGVLANMLLGTATYDAMIAAWDSKYAYKRHRPFEADSRIKSLIPNPASPSYPCEHSVAAGVAATIIAHYFPAMADSVNRLARQVLDSRVAAGAAFPSDTRAGFELGKKIAEMEITHTKGFVPGTAWDGKRPEQPGLWKGKPMYPLAGKNKTVVLDSSSQFRPGPPPDFAKEMEELKKFKPTFRSTANAFYFATQSFWDEALHQKIFEYNIHLNPPKAAMLYALTAVAAYDGFSACWDAKYAYWATRPDQYDTSFRPVLFFTPPFPGYPSGHAMMGGMMAELYSYFFPAEKALFMKKAKDGAESRFQGGIHFRSDNDAGLELGRKIGSLIVQKAKTDGAPDINGHAFQKNDLQAGQNQSPRATVIKNQ
jgi:membrane-associated phospholipid phosphatase